METSESFLGILRIHLLSTMFQCCLVFRGIFFLKNLKNYSQRENIGNVCHIKNLEVILTPEVFSGCQQVFDTKQSAK